MSKKYLVSGTVKETIGDQPIPLGGTELPSVSVPKYKSYTAALTQSGTAAPVVTVLDSNLGFELTWTRHSVGRYKVIGPDNTFAVGRFAGFVAGQNVNHTVTLTAWEDETFTTGMLDVVDGSTNTVQDGRLYGTVIEIRIYE